MSLDHINTKKKSYRKVAILMEDLQRTSKFRVLEIGKEKRELLLLLLMRGKLNR